MHNSYYITKANFLRLFRVLKKVYTISGETLYKYPIPELSNEKQQELLLIKCFLKEPASLASVLPKVRKADNFGQLFAPSAPAYHLDLGCERLHSHYFNLQLPQGINGMEERVTRCRQMFEPIFLHVQSAEMPNATYREQITESVRRLIDEIKRSRYFQRAFHLSGHSLHNLTKDHFLPIERGNSSSTALGVEAEIDKLYDAYKQEVNRLRVEMQAQAIFRKSYEEQITILLVDLIIYSYNQGLVFEEDVLKALGFAPCYTCCGYDDDEDEQDNEMPDDTIEAYREYVERTFDLIKCAGKFKMANSIHDPLPTPDDIKQASQGFYFCLHALYGFLEIAYKKDNGGWHYADAPKDRYGNPLEFEWFEFWLAKYKDLSPQITSTKHEVIILPLKE